jgi:predicted transcriptional regulator
MKAVLISIQPKWCALIASGKKTVEVRKSIPKLNEPFKCYIYCTKGPGELMHDQYTCSNGKVIGEFICDTYTFLGNISTDKWDHLVGSTHEWFKRLVTESAYLTEEELLAYGGKFAWHISNLVIYDKPLDVSEFWKPDKCPWVSTKGCTYEYHCFRAGQTKRCGDTLSRPPQSWCYVERREK